MKKMQKLSPKMNAIRDKYKKAKTDAAQREKMNEELMKLYQAEGYNPMSGCLPMLIQLPILVAFYNVLRFSIELRHAPFFLWIRDLSAVDHTYVLLILMIVSMYVQQAMTPTTADPAQKKIFMAMPLIMGHLFQRHALGSGALLALLQRPDGRPASAHQQDGEQGRARAEEAGAHQDRQSMRSGVVR